MRRIGSSRLQVIVTVLALLGVAARPALACVGDCNGNGSVSVDELVKGVNVALGSLALQACEAIDAAILHAPYSLKYRAYRYRWRAAGQRECSRV